VAGKSAEAYALLEPDEFEQAGNTKFDYLLGLAALNSGQTGKASVILERVLAVDPFHAAARVDLGRAYFQLGDFERARAELERAQALNPPPSALATISRYLGEIETLSNQPATRLSGFLEAGGGYNNNVNNSNTQSQITVPALLNTQLTLNSANIKTSDGYLGLAGGVEILRPLSQGWAVYAGVDIRSRNDLKYSHFNYISLDGRAGASFEKNAEHFQGGWMGGRFDQGGTTVNRNFSGLNAEWRHSCNSSNQSVLFGLHLVYRYPDPALASNNFDQTIGGLGWMHVFADGNSTAFGSFFGGNERDTNLRIDGGKSIQGVRLSGQATLGQRTDLFAYGGIQWGKYKRTNSAFLVVREDRQTDLAIGLIYRYGPNWILRPQISLISNQSNIIVYRYEQADFSLTLRRDFN